MELDFLNRHIVVTGGTGALGSAVVGLLTAHGARCSIPVFNRAELDRFPLRGDARVRTYEGIDLTEQDSVEQFFTEAGRDAEAAGATRGLWASIHAAGGFAMSPVRQTDGPDFMRQIEMNALTCFLSCREAVRRMSGLGEQGGRIVNVAARPALEPRLGAGMSAYTASKAAVAALTQAIGEEVAKDGILVNAVVPSIMDTPANRAAMPDADHAKWPKVQDVAATIAFLASPANTSTRGGLIPVYGRS